jgi:hypothetical protein
MSLPQLTDANTSSEWFRTVAEPGAADKPRSAAQAGIRPADSRRKRFVRLVTYTMVGLVAFTLLGVARFAWRQHAMQSALAASVPAAVAAREVPPTPSLAPAAETAPEAKALAPAAVAPVAPVAPAKAAAAAAVRAKKAAVRANVAKKAAARSPILSSAKPPTKTARR